MVHSCNFGFPTFAPIEGGSKGTYRVVTIRFKSKKQMYLYEADYYDDIRPKIQDWLDRHFPGETIIDGDDIEPIRHASSHTETIDVSTI